MFAKAAVLEYAREPRVRPLLILEHATEMSEPTAGGERRDLALSGLPDRGFTVPRTAGKFPVLAEGWLLQHTLKPTTRGDCVCPQSRRRLPTAPGHQPPLWSAWP